MFRFCKLIAYRESKGRVELLLREEKLYGFKVEVAVRKNGLASAFSPHFPGSVQIFPSCYGELSFTSFDQRKLGMEREEDD